MPHRTARYGGSRRAPYVASLRQWSNFMRVLDEQGMTVGELERRARAKPQLDAMRRWGYVTVGPDPDDPRRRPPERALLVVPTEAGRQAQAVWRPLPAAIETRWRARFGAEEMDELRATLQGLRDGLGLNLPRFLTGFYGGYAAKPWEGSADEVDDPLPLPALLSQVLQAFALEYEQEATASLCYSANVVRLLDEDGANVGQLPRRSGVAIEPIRRLAPGAARSAAPTCWRTFPCRVRVGTPMGLQAPAPPPRCAEAPGSASHTGGGGSWFRLPR